ncbi:ABC transporter permease [Glycomyces xiaoerkulensis]|uniref:ABC transporter permease n=1 Tax=Glycomyces xiaoerkulensis TaxID=2038139 RepID=UPI000C26B57B|nr:ABC transporter permease [Glycomyces xiaoerkulensis]
MNGLRAALRVEARKAATARVLQAGAVLLVGGAGVLGASLTAAVEAGNDQVAAKLGQVAATDGWPLMVGTVSQIVAAGALLTFGITLSWVFGREFTDGTVYGLFALPVSRTAQTVAKFTVHFGWSVVAAAALTGLVAVAGLAIGLGGLDDSAATGLGRLFVLCAVSGLVAAPAAWAATLGRGPMAGIATTIGLIVLAQVAVLAFPSGSAWFPIAAPALWALRPDEVTVAQLALIPVFAAGFAALTARAWNRLQLDR